MADYSPTRMENAAPGLPSAGRYRSKIGIADRLFFLWILLVPFSNPTSYYFGIGLDKALSPLILLVGIFQLRKLRSQHINRVFFYGAIAIAFILIKDISVLSSSELFLTGILRTSISVGYFIIPLLYIRNINYLRTVNSLLIIVAITTCLSAFLASIGVISLPYQRFEVSRLGLEFLPKSVGILSAYGELAQIIAYTMLTIYLIPKAIFFFGHGSRFVKGIIFLILLLGLLGSQSRNALLSLILSGVFAWLILLNSSRGGRKQVARTFLMVAGLLLFVAFLLLAGGAVFNAISGMGGEVAQGNAEGRLDQYKFALDVIAQFPILGADAVTYSRVGFAIDGVHNMWLKLAARGGLVTAGIMLFWIVSSVVASLRLASRPGRTPETIVVAAYLPTLVFSTMFYGGQGILFFMLFGVATSLVCMGTQRGAG